MINGKTIFEHVVIDKMQDLIFKVFLGVGEQVVNKGVEYVKSQPFGIGLNDEISYAQAELYAIEYLGLTRQDLERLTAYLKELTPAQFNELRLIVGRNCQTVEVEGKSGSKESVLVNPDGAAILKYLASCSTLQEFEDALHRWGADKNAIDISLKKFGDAKKWIANNPVVQSKVQQTKGWFAELNTRSQDLADRLNNSFRR